MRDEPQYLPDWRDAAAYARLLDIERAGFAWEWLRREAAYREASLTALRDGPDEEPAGLAARAAIWGLHAFEPPWRGALSARPVWRREAHVFVLEAEALDEGPPDERLDVAALRPFATLLEGRGGEEHLLISDGRASLRLDIVAGSLRAGPAKLRYRLAGFAGAEMPHLVLRQLLAFRRSGRLSPALHPPVRAARRWILILRAHDALAAGAGQREIAAALFGAEAGGPRWRVAAPSLRSRAQRLVREARRMGAGGYRSLLAPRPPAAVG